MEAPDVGVERALELYAAALATAFADVDGFRRFYRLRLGEPAPFRLPGASAGSIVEERDEDRGPRWRILDAQGRGFALLRPPAPGTRAWRVERLR